MKSYLPLSVIILMFLQTACSQNAPDAGKGVQWLTFEQAAKKAETEPRKIFIDVYTHWCGWCKRMDATTFRDSAVVRNLNKNFYAVKVDAESKDTVRFRDKTFVYRPEYKANELALSLLNGNMGYPTTVYLDENFNILTVKPGYQDAKGLQSILSFYAENKHKNQSLDDYLKEK